MNTSPKEAAPVPYEGYGTGDLKMELEKTNQQIATLQQRIADLEAANKRLDEYIENFRLDHEALAKENIELQAQRRKGCGGCDEPDWK